MLKSLFRKQPNPAPAAEARADEPLALRLPSVEMLDGQPGELATLLEIAHLLRSVRDEQSLTLISLPDDHVSSGVTTVLEVGLQANILVVAGLPDSELTQKMLEATGPLMVSTSFDQVYITFEVDGLEATDHFGRPALKARLPKSVTYMQRRDAFRIGVPSFKGVSCTILQNDRPIHPTAGKLDVRDLSVIGLALSDAARVLDTTPGKVYDARLDIPHLGAFDIILSVVHATDEESAGKGVAKARRVGCAFVDMPQGVRIRIQSFIGGLQREEIMRQRGLL
ncbi:MAG TPA: flagellar regulator YcgR PilZN domain-containing protein [Bordetella sp.]